MNFVVDVCLTFTKQTHQPGADNPTASQNWCHYQNQSETIALVFTQESSCFLFPCLSSTTKVKQLVLAHKEGAEGDKRQVCPGSSNPAVFSFLFQHLHCFWGKLCSLRMPSQTVTDIHHLRCHKSVLLCPLIRSPLFRNCKLQDSCYLPDEPAWSQLWL